MSPIRKWQIVAVTSLAVAAVALTAAFSGWAAGAPAPVNVAYVDTAVLLSRHPAAQKAQADLQKELQALQAEFDKKSAGMSQDEKMKLFNEYQQRLDARKAAVLASVTDELKSLIAQTAKKTGYNLVLDKQVVLYGGHDLTEDVLKAANVKK